MDRIAFRVQFSNVGFGLAVPLNSAKLIGDGSEARKAIGDPPELSIAFDAKVKELKKT